MSLFNRDPARAAARAEYRAARKALANDPVNNGSLGTVDIDSPEGQANLATQQRLINAEKNLRSH